MFSTFGCSQYDLRVLSSDLRGESTQITVTNASGDGLNLQLTNETWATIAAELKRLKVIE